MAVMLCPACHEPARRVALRTVKAMLTGAALRRLRPDDDFHFCASPGCNVVYFASDQVFRVADVRQRVFQKDASADAPVCYCFDWTRESLIAAVHRGVRPDEDIEEQVRERRCACDLRNPQGACCLGNVKAILASARARS
ncbi:putative iron-sulfur cluster-binding metallochaperone [Alicyclobacillus acidocaldarius]|nr:copper chaperone Copz family protein [Alicyclobacillus acidocaldarius]